MSYQIKIDMDDKSLLKMLTHLAVLKCGVNLGQVYDHDDIHLAKSECEKLEEFGFRTKITNNEKE